MTLAEFKQSPWQKSHQTYKESALAISPAPEYASSEVLVASLYRTIGFDSISEGGVPKAGRDLEGKLRKLHDKQQAIPDGAILDADAWSGVLHGVLESPKLPNQSSKRFLQVTPLVPSLSVFSGSARLSSNSWPAGSLVRRMAWLGSRDHDTALSLWKELFSALEVGEDDDVFARWLEQETSSWGASPKWELAKVDPQDVANFSIDDFEGVPFMPARQFASDLRAIMKAKPSMTRRQWTSLLEAILRLSAVSHVTWLCDVQSRIWRCLLEAVDGNGPSGTEDVRDLVFPKNPQYMTYGGKALHGLKDKASAYLTARLGINTLLWSLEEAGLPFHGSLSSSAGIAQLCTHVRENRGALDAMGVRMTFSDLREREARALNCKKGIGANILEFSRHALGQRQTASQLLRGYDQGYVLKKRGSSPSSPWIVALGPVSILALVHCSLAGMGGPRSIHRLEQHLAAYGVVIDRHDIARNDLGQQLRMLGLVLDSPDAESGMLLLPPFPSSNQSLDKKE
ncbi:MULTISPECIES: hypothetical protein [Pseudomonadota]|uniref:hypothetical protein n=1 Tax=Pseudomonadota TaxID=1224 RepID=UPI0009BFF585|nr:MULTISPECIES: hypothetical protein [Pseudomonadota]VEH28667.1 Uncharacterised protein [Bordetella hinzii]HCF1891994.1 hypothetical protein [Pseudomonas aeruginosa]HCF1895326.1 hypothetical protein [Pseudomonas aeruginosa]